MICRVRKVKRFYAIIQGESPAGLMKTALAAVLFLMLTLPAMAQSSPITETFTNMGPYGGYQTETWTGDDGGTWTATDARTDQTINGDAICVRNGTLSSPTTSGGVGSLTVTTQRVFGGGSGNMDVRVNGVSVGSVPYDGTQQTTTINNINISGNITVVIDATNSSSDRVAIDDLSWTAYSGGGSTKPSISSIAHAPAAPTSAESVSVTAEVTDADGIFGVELHWGTASGSLGNTINMSNTGGNTYETDTDIPAQAAGTTVYYEIYALDNNVEDSTSAEYSYSVSAPSLTVTIHDEDFSSCASTQWIEQSVSSDADWSCGSGVFEINAYSSSAAAEDYLISPSFNLDNYSNEELSFQSWTRYSDAFYPAVEILYTNNYTGDPSTTTWNSIPGATFSAENSQSWTGSGILDISGISGTDIRFAFKYTSSGTGGGSSSYWKIDDILIEGQNAPSSSVVLSMTDDGSITEGNEDAEQITVSISGDTLLASLNIANWTFSNLPSGVSVSNLSRTNDTAAVLTLSGNASTDYDSDVTDFTVEIAHQEFKNLSSGSESVSTGVTFTATNDVESISMNDDGLITEGAEDGELISVTLTGGNFVNPITPSNWSFSGQPAGVSIGSVNRISAIEAEITLSGNASSDYNSNITNAELSIAASEVDDHSGSPLTTNTGVTFTAYIISMSDDGSITEGNEHSEQITVSISGDTLVDPLSLPNWTFSNLPGGVTVNSISRINDTAAVLILSGNATTDYDTDITNFTVEASHQEYKNLSSGSQSVSTGVTFTANNDAESISMSDDGLITEGAEDGELISVTLSGGTFADPLSAGNWTLSGQPAGVSIGSVNRISATEAEITLSGNASSDYDTDINDAELQIDAAEIDDHSGAAITTASGITFTAVIEPAPTVQATNIGFSNISSTTVDVSWTRGNGEKVLLLVSGTTRVDSLPEDGTDYTADSEIPLGDTIGIDEYVAYEGTGTSATISGLLQGNRYHFRLFEFNNSGTATRYLRTTATLNPDSVVTSPNDITNFSVDCISKSTADLSWTPPTGVYEGIVIAIREDNNYPHVLSGKGDTISADTVFGNGYEYGGTTPKSYVVYNGSGNQVSVSGLNAGVEYTFKAYTYNGTTWSSGTVKSPQTTEIPEVSSVSHYAPNHKMVISWTNPVFSCVDEVMVVLRQSNPVTGTPSGDGSAYTANTSFGSGSTVVPNEYVVYKGNGNNVEITNLINDTTYYFKIFVRDGTEWSDGIGGDDTPDDISILFPGDLAIVAINTNYKTSGGGDDEISLVAFDTIKTNTAIDFTDNGWERDNPDKWGNTEGTIRFTRTGPDILPGQVFTFRGSGHSPGDFSGHGLPDNSWAVSSLNGNHDYNLNSSDQIWIMQYGSWAHGTGTNHDATYTGNILYGWTATGWAGDPGHGSPGDTDYSELYPGSTCFNTNVVNTSYSDKVKYTGPTSAATRRTWVQRINNPDNWTGYDDNGTTAGDYDHISTPQYSSGVTFTILADTLEDGEWIGDRDTNWYYCGNWGNLSVPDENTNVFIRESSERNAVISSTAPYSDEYNDTAWCYSLAIEQDSLLLQSSVDILNIFGDVTIDGGVLAPGDGRLNIKGDWLNHDANGFAAANSMVHFNGVSQQQIENTASSEVFNRLHINNSFDVKMQSELETDSLVFEDGHLFLTDYDLSVNTAIRGADVTKYLVCKNDNASAGHLNMNAAGSSTLFPIGTASSYTPLRITSNSGASEFKVRTFDDIFENGYSGNALIGYNVYRSWVVEPVSGGAANADIELQWNITEEPAGYTPYRSTSMMVQTDGSGTGTFWDDWNSITGSSVPTGANPFFINASGITDFGVFGISERCEILKPKPILIYHF